MKLLHYITILLVKTPLKGNKLNENHIKKTEINKNYEEKTIKLAK